MREESVPVARLGHQQYGMADKTNKLGVTVESCFGPSPIKQVKVRLHHGLLGGWGLVLGGHDNEGYYVYVSRVSPFDSLNFLQEASRQPLKPLDES